MSKPRLSHLESSPPLDTMARGEVVLRAWTKFHMLPYLSDF